MPLKNYTAIPPGGYQYSQAGLDGAIIKKFSSTSMPFNLFCAPILALRTANKLSRATMVEVKTDVDEAQCERLNFDPDWCQKKTPGFSRTRHGN